MTTIEFKNFIEEGKRIEHSLKSSLGRINKTLNSISEFLEFYVI